MGEKIEELYPALKKTPTNNPENDKKQIVEYFFSDFFDCESEVWTVLLQAKDEVLSVIDVYRKEIRTKNIEGYTVYHAFYESPTSKVSFSGEDVNTLDYLIPGNFHVRFDRDLKNKKVTMKALYNMNPTTKPGSEDSKIHKIIVLKQTVVENGIVTFE